MVFYLDFLFSILLGRGSLLVDEYVDGIDDTRYTSSNRVCQSINVCQ